MPQRLLAGLAALAALAAGSLDAAPVTSGEDGPGGDAAAAKAAAAKVAFARNETAAAEAAEARANARAKEEQSREVDLERQLAAAHDALKKARAAVLAANASAEESSARDASLLDEDVRARTDLQRQLVAVQQALEKSRQTSWPQALRGPFQWALAAAAGLVGVLLTVGPAALVSLFTLLVGPCTAGLLLGSCAEYFALGVKPFTDDGGFWLDAVFVLLSGRGSKVAYGAWVALALIGVLRRLYACSKDSDDDAAAAPASRRVTWHSAGGIGEMPLLGPPLPPPPPSRFSNMSNSSGGPPAFSSLMAGKVEAVRRALTGEDAPEVWHKAHRTGALLPGAPAPPRPPKAFRR